MLFDYAHIDKDDQVLKFRTYTFLIVI